MKSFLSTEYLKAGAAWLILIVGAGLYLIGFFLIEEKHIWHHIVIKVADALVIGVVLRFVTDAARFIGIFKQELQDIIYGKKYVSNLKDVYPLWENLSKELFKNKFPDIHQKFLKTVNNYLPKDEVSYYDDYEIHTTINWIDRDRGIIEATDDVSFDLVAETDKSISYPIRTWTRTRGGETYSSRITTITVNNQTPENLGEARERQESDGNICQEQQLTLQGDTRYRIRYTRVKTYDIKEDFCVGFRAKYIVNGLRVCLSLPDDIYTIFACRGTQKDFEDVVNRNHRIEKRYRGIVLPRQGYVFSLRAQMDMANLQGDMEG